MVGKRQRIANQTQVWAETWHLASSRSQHAQQVPASSEARGPTWLSYHPHPQGHRGLAPSGKQALHARPGLVCSLVIRHLGRAAYTTIILHPQKPGLWGGGPQGTLWDLDARADPWGT